MMYLDLKYIFKYLGVYFGGCVGCECFSWSCADSCRVSEETRRGQEKPREARLVQKRPGEARRRQKKLRDTRTDQGKPAKARRGEERMERPG